MEKTKRLSIAGKGVFNWMFPLRILALTLVYRLIMGFTTDFWV